MYNPVSTYRIQFNKDFRFQDAEKILSYLHKSGIKTIYASPVFQSVKGSLHGYDVTSPVQINHEIGNENIFKKLIDKMHGLSMGWLQDFVPNHMAYSTGNPWIYDILEKGVNSEYYDFFDILKDHPDTSLQGKIMLPFFGKPLENLISDKELSLSFTEKGFFIHYFDDNYPVSHQAYPAILNALPKTSPPQHIKSFIQDTKNPKDWSQILKTLFSGYRNDKRTNEYIEKCISRFNDDPKQMRILVSQLCYLPVFWRETEKRINYRRFFTINGLICLKAEKQEVFETCHKLVYKWVKEQMINGLRIDHIDGLYDPGGYLDKLQQLMGKDTYLSVEKILMKDEELPSEWPVHGTTGYDFLSMVNNLLANRKNGSDFYSYYSKWNDEKINAHDFFFNKKKFILFNRLKGELDYLSSECEKLLKPGKNKYSHDNIRDAVAAFLLNCPVYKIYHSPSEFNRKDKALINEIFRNAFQYKKENKKTVRELKKLFLLENFKPQGKTMPHNYEASPGELNLSLSSTKGETEGELKNADNKETEKINSFFKRCMQFTGPLTAKGIEDTSFYSYNAFIGFNEVGDSPEYFGISKKEFHNNIMTRLQESPTALNTLATHDTKRGEDARARLNVLSDIPQKWMKSVEKWHKINKKQKTIIDGKEIPSLNDEYFIYQSLCAHLPMKGTPDQSFIERFHEFLIKAIREAKVRSSWSEPDEIYEKGTLEFIDKTLAPESEYLKELHLFMEEIIPHGIINSITQLILKNTVPGTPDTFQGTETWNLSFVDPDNRRPVNYDLLSKDLDKMISDHSSNAVSMIEQLWQHPENGKIKQWVSYLTLKYRNDFSDLFLKGSYIPLKVKGRLKKHVIAFYRRYRDQHLCIILPLNTASMPDQNNWENTKVKLPGLAPLQWENIFNKEVLQTNGAVKVNDIFKSIAFGIFSGIPNKPERKAGILMHISSLPGKYGIGDFGKETKKFIDFLYRTGQSYWQILPLSQSDKLTSYSPYSSFSAFAGNILLIDPEQLAEDGFLSGNEIKKCMKKSGSTVDYRWAEKAKKYFLETAYRNFKKTPYSEKNEKFEKFRENEKYWLTDYALFFHMKKHFNGKLWNKWPKKYRDRNQEALNEYTEQHKEEIEKICFDQFLFVEQWNRIKTYANDRGIDIFGDIPIYVDYDSADVWANPDLFKLKRDRSMESVAGVPPDYFNENGQLWGMPLFHWKNMKQNGYDWWIKRIKKNLEWFDLLRLDHFRGFSAFWEVPADSEVAINGKWIPGPGSELFDAIHKEFPEMPFVAEDLGQIDQAVYDLRDQFELPGMRVVQFGFGEKMPFLQHCPSNFTYNSIAYTGTHDNNTIKGWYKHEAGKSTLKRYKQFTGNKLKEKNCHKELIRVTYSSVAKVAIIPMQDWLGLDEKSRMNFPSTTEGNWEWRMKKDQLTGKLEKQIRKYVKTFGRY